MPDHTDRPIYHLTHSANLDGMLAANGLLSYSCLQADRTVSIAHRGIQDRRQRCAVRCGPGGVLHDYVPFYFGCRSPMLYAVHKGQVESYSGGQDPLVYLVTTPRAVVDAGCGFVFTDGHAIVKLSGFYDRLESLSEVDWALMKSRMWTDTDTDGDRRRRRQAEFLVYQFVPWTTMPEIGTRCEATRDQVEEQLATRTHKPPVVVVPAWFY